MVGVFRARRARVALMVAGGVVMSALVSVGPASAAISASASFTMPDGAGVGATGLPGSITVSNLNSAPDQNESNQVNEILFAPSCGTVGTTVFACATPDPGVFSVNSPATGAPGTACAGQVFSFSPPDANGVFTVQHNAPVVLGPPGGQAPSSCTINFTMTVKKVPGIDVSASPGVQTDANLQVRETGLVSGLMPIVAVSQLITVNRGILPLTTQASPGVAVGGSVGDAATLAFTPTAALPTGTVTFTLFGPNDSVCSGASPPSKTSAVVNPGTASTSGFVVTQPGVYRFVASYSGDANYLPITAPCNAPNESLTVTGTTTHRAVADFNGDGITDISVFRPSTGQWLAKGILDTVYGESTDIPVPGDYNGDNTTDIAVFRPSTGQWLVKGISETVYGASTDIPVPGDYNGDGTTDIAVFRPSTGQWLVRGISETVYGASGDVPVPGNYNAGNTTDIAVFRPTTGQWLVRGISETVYGESTDAPLPLPSAIRRAYFLP